MSKEAPVTSAAKGQATETGYPDHSTCCQVLGVREAMGRLPFWCQRPLTWITGRALPGQRAIITLTPAWRFVHALGLLLCGTAASATLVQVDGPWLLVLPMSWLLTVSGSRMIHTMIVHHAAHNALYRRRWVNVVVCELLTTVLLLQPFRRYADDHLKIHHGRDLATLHDPDLQFLLMLGIRPGRSRRALWIRLWLNVISPVFHLRFLSVRLIANFVGVPRYRWIMSSAYLLAIGILLVNETTRAAVGWAWLFPIVPLYQPSAFLQWCSEHAWLRQPASQELSRDYLAKLTPGRFMGESPPTPGLPWPRRMLAWTGWWGRMLFLHLPLRLYVLPGDLPQHDWHHRHPSRRAVKPSTEAWRKAWPNALYARQLDIDSGHAGWPCYIEFWGLAAAIDNNLRFLSELPPSGLSRGGSTREKTEVLLDM